MILSLLAGGNAARAQELAVRAELAAFRDSLEAITDSAAVARLERSVERAARRRDDPALLLRQGLAALRHGELGNEHRFARARRAFGHAAGLEPSWPWPPYALALAHAAEFVDQRADSLEIGTRPGANHLNDAVRSLAAALERDATFAPALVALEQLAWTLHEPDNWDTALAAFRAATAARSANPSVLLALGRLEREIGSADSAIAALEAAGRRLGASAAASEGMVMLELARTRLQRGLAGGVDEYLAGAAYDDSAVVAGYRGDLVALVADSVLAEFDAAHGDARAAALRRFWEDRARIELRSLEERLREHYRRLHRARRHFALSITRRHQQPSCPYRSGSMEFDDRGIIYVRHGEPTRRLRPVLFTVMPNETWRYDRADGDLVFHFGAGIDVHDYRLLESATDVLGRCSGPRGGSPPTVSEVWLSRDAIDPMYGKLAAWDGTAAGRRLAEEERAIGAASLEIGTTTDSHELRFDRPLRAIADVVAVGRRGDRTIAHVVFGIRGGAVPGELIDGSWRYRVRVRVAAYGPDRRVVGYLDSTAVYTMPAPLDSTRHLFGRMELPLPAGTWQVRTAVELGSGAGAVLPIDSVRVVSTVGDGLRVSDLAIGWRPIALTWPRAADTVYFSPLRSYAADDELELYYEVYGLEPGTEYATRLEIVSREPTGLFRRRQPGVRLGFRDQAAGGTASARRTVRLADLRPGAYWLDVIVTDSSGRDARRRIAFEVERRRRDE